MKPETLKALEASIEKWKRNAKAETWYDYHTSTDDCPLCDLFIHKSCSGCPVSENPEHGGCRNQEYRDAYKAWSDWIDGDAEKMSAHAAALREVAFLESLLPKEKS